ncbi:MAG: septum formation initiator family protein [Bacteroidota bacterium]
MNFGIPEFFKNFYICSLLIFTMWMLFFDSNDLLSQYRLSQKLNSLESDKLFYEQKIEEVKEEREELFSNNELLEKFAREKYMMRKDNEDVYIVVKK